MSLGKWIVAAMGLAVLGTAAAAEPRIDFVPTNVSFIRALGDDVSNTYYQKVSLRIRNQGNIAWHNGNSSIRINLGGRILTGSIYGWIPNGQYWQLGAAVQPGVDGLVTVGLPLNTLTHCQNLSVTIDLLHNQQVGPSVFANDTRTLKAFNAAMANRPCLVNPLPQP